MVIAKLIKDVVFMATGISLGTYVITGNIKAAISLLILSSVCVGILIGENAGKKTKKKIWRNKNYGKNESM